MEINDLDVVLESINEMDSRMPSTFIQIFSKDKKFSYTDKEGELILDKLVRDGYVQLRYGDTKDKEGNNIKSKLALYNITYDGHIFLKQGGYYEEFTLSKLREKKIAKETSLVRIATVATILVGVFYLFEILRVYIPILCDWLFSYH